MSPVGFFTTSKAVKRLEQSEAIERLKRFEPSLILNDWNVLNLWNDWNQLIADRERVHYKTEICIFL
jgi:hypothetical protein